MPLQKLSDRHLEIIRRIVCGQRNYEICAAMGVDEQYLSILKADPLFKAELHRVRQAVQQTFEQEAGSPALRSQFTDHAQEALETLLDLMRSSRNERVRQMSAMDILDRAGYKPTERVEAKHTITTLDDRTADDIRKAVADLKALRAAEQETEQASCSKVEQQEEAQ